MDHPIPKRCRTSNKIVNAYESLVTETAHAQYALREETKVADVNMDGGSRKSDGLRHKSHCL